MRGGLRARPIQAHDLSNGLNQRCADSLTQRCREHLAFASFSADADFDEFMMLKCAARFFNNRVVQPAIGHNDHRFKRVSARAKCSL